MRDPEDVKIAHTMSARIWRSKHPERVKELREKYAPSLRAARKKYVDKNKLEIQQFYEQWSKSCACSKCGFSNFAALSFYHADESDKKFDVNYSLQSANRPMRLILKEMVKCVVVCANCKKISDHRALKSGPDPVNISWSDDLLPSAPGQTEPQQQ